MYKSEEVPALSKAKTKKEIASEFADILTAIEEIKTFKKVKQKDIKMMLIINFKRKGGFKTRENTSLKNKFLLAFCFAP